MWRNRTEGSPLPAFCLSDNTNSGPATSALVGSVATRCAVHLLQIIVKTLCFYIKQDAPSEHDRCPPLLSGLQKLRDIARSMRKGFLHTEWKRRKLGGRWRATLPLDSSCDWDSTAKLIARALSLRQNLATFATFVTLPCALPSATEWLYLENALQCLQHVQRPCLVLQADCAKAAQVLPLAQFMREKLLNCAESHDNEGLEYNVATLCEREWTRILMDHLGTLSRPTGATDPIWDLFRRASIHTLYDLWELCAVCAVGIPNLPPTDDAEVQGPGSVARELRAKFERFLILAAGHNPSDRTLVPPPEHGLAPSVPATRSTVPSTGRRNAREKHKGLADYFAQVCAN